MRITVSSFLVSASLLFWIVPSHGEENRNSYETITVTLHNGPLGLSASEVLPIGHDRVLLGYPRLQNADMGRLHSWLREPTSSKRET